MTNGGHRTEVEKPDGGRQAEWSDSAPSNSLPLPWTHCAAEKVKRCRPISGSLPVFVFSLCSHSQSTIMLTCLSCQTSLFCIHGRIVIYPESCNLFHYTALMTDPNSRRLTNSGNATICNGKDSVGSDSVHHTGSTSPLEP